MMKDVVIDNRKELVMVDGKVVPRILLRTMRGAVGRSFVVKRYTCGRMVVTHFPDMSGIVASGKQKVRRDLFREAVAFAKWVIADEQRKLAFRNTLPRKKRRKVYQAALQLYIRMKGNKLWVRKVLESMERQGVLHCVDVRKELAMKAVVESGKHEQLNIETYHKKHGRYPISLQAFPCVY